MRACFVASAMRPLRNAHTPPPSPYLALAGSIRALCRPISPWRAQYGLCVALSRPSGLNTGSCYGYASASQPHTPPLTSLHLACQRPPFGISLTIVRKPHPTTSPLKKYARTSSMKKRKPACAGFLAVYPLFRDNAAG